VIEISVPGYKKLVIKYLVMDFNGTMACDGILLKGLEEQLKALANRLEIHVLTADTFGRAAAELSGLPTNLVILPQANQDRGKLEYIRKLGPAFTVCIGNGRNDRFMLKEAGLGIALLQEEGVAVETLMSADIVSRNIKDALALLTHTKRMVATLRS